jgi:hypothetical protein
MELDDHELCGLERGQPDDQDDATELDVALRHRRLITEAFT